MTTLLGQHAVRQHGRLRLWPENGMIKIEDSRDGSYKAITIKEALERARALNDMIRNSLDRGRTQDSMFYADELDSIQRLVEDVIDMCRIAKSQGDPTDANVVRDKIDSFIRPVAGVRVPRKAKSGKRITMPSTANNDFGM